MENSFSNSGEGIVDAMLLEDQQPDFYSQTFSLTGPGDEDEDESEDESEEGDEQESGDEDASKDDENPPLDKDIVHSHVPLRTGGKP